MINSQEKFKSTSRYYSQYRLGFPSEFLEFMLKELKIENFNRLLDLGCGTGQLALPLSNYFKDVIAIDSSEEMIHEGLRVAKHNQVSNIEYLSMPAENVSNEFGVFDLIVCGSVFHWMGREKVASLMYSLLSSNGGIAIVDQGSLWTGKETWQKEVVRVIKKWLGEDRQAGNSTYKESSKRHEDIIRQFPFSSISEKVIRTNTSGTLNQL